MRRSSKNFRKPALRRRSMFMKVATVLVLIMAASLVFSGYERKSHQKLSIAHHAP